MSVHHRDAVRRIPSCSSSRNEFERFREGWRGLELIIADSNSIFVVADFFERVEFLVCSGFNHTQCDCACACAVVCLHPHNFISNVVVSLTIHDNMKICKDAHIRDVAKNETIVEGQRLL